jgi:hypothetical protein
MAVKRSTRLAPLGVVVRASICSCSCPERWLGTATYVPVSQPKLRPFFSERSLPSTLAERPLRVGRFHAARPVGQEGG